ncbi:MAG: hypothetical protein AB4206_15460 [Xenococcaceae cyanobacterium]
MSKTGFTKSTVEWNELNWRKIQKATFKLQKRIYSWKTEQTYHYLTYQEVERSRREFTVNPQTPDKKLKS